MTNSELDKAVLSAVAAGHLWFFLIVALVRYQHDDRAVDRSLQRLRKAGRIEYQNGWRVTVREGNTAAALASVLAAGKKGPT